MPPLKNGKSKRSKGTGYSQAGHASPSKGKGRSLGGFATASLFLLFTLAAVYASVALVEWFANRQMETFSVPGHLLFVQGQYTVELLVVAMVGLAFCMTGRLAEWTKKRIAGFHPYTFAMAVIVLLTGCLLADRFFSYTVLNRDSIETRSGLLSSSTLYSWNEVDGADISYRFTGKNRHFSPLYRIMLRDGTVIEASNSREFFERIVETDRYLQSRGVPIARQRVAAKDEASFVAEFAGEGSASVDRLAVLRLLFAQ